MPGDSQAGSSFPGIFAPGFVDALLLPERRKRSRTGNGRGGSKQSTRASSSYGRVLLFGKHRELALYRAAVLQHSGFKVEIPRTRQEAVDAIRHGDFDAAILSYTLSGETVEEIAELVRQRCPSCPVISISQESTVDRRIAPDAIVLAEDGPQALLSTLQRLLGKRVQ